MNSIKADIYGNVNSFRQNLQIEYTNLLIGALTGKQSSQYTNNAKSMALYSLKNIRAMAKTIRLRLVNEFMRDSYY